MVPTSSRLKTTKLTFTGLLEVTKVKKVFLPCIFCIYDNKESVIGHIELVKAKHELWKALWPGINHHFQWGLTENIIPSSWKESKTVFLHKRTIKELKDYPPICLLSQN